MTYDVGADRFGAIDDWLGECSIRRCSPIIGANAFRNVTLLIECHVAPSLSLYP